MTIATVEIHGERFVVLPEREFLQMRGGRARNHTSLPPLPPRDEEGCRPAAEFIAATIARRLVTGRRAAGLSQDQLAKLAGIRQETLSRLESGKHSPTVRTLEKIERALAKLCPPPTKRRKR
jgi:ribosome-binding protein aMBF1 (putative translation factor)